MLEAVPWMIEGGAKHTANLGRNVAYAAFAGREGIVAATDLEVRELATPGAAIQVYPGTAAIFNRSESVEAYVARNTDTSEQVSIAATTTAARSDLIVLRVNNPQYDGDAPLPDGPFAEIDVITCDPTDTTLADAGLPATYSGLVLARVDQPDNNSTITQAMITDLRKMSGVRNQRAFNINAQVNSEVLSSTGYTNWPNEANFTVDVPEWATRVNVRAFLAGVRFGGSGDNGGAGWNVWGDLRVQFADQYSAGTAYNESNEGGRDQATLMAGASGVYVPASVRGGQTTVRIEGKRDGGSTNLDSTAGTTVSIEVEFIEEPESNV